MSRARSVLLVLALLASSLALPRPAAAQQQPQHVPERPRLASRADTNDWEAYYDYGVAQSAQAAELAPDDPLMQYRHGIALLMALRTREAAAPLERSIAIAPWYAAPRFALGQALQAGGDRAAARDAFEGYAALAPRTDSSSVAVARKEAARLADPPRGN
jgi:tetratricopeptide (TPR) repeat protein